jgi:mRNA interferase MazF
VTRGDVIITSGGPDYLGKPRPAVVVQAIALDSLSSITVCPTTTQAGGDEAIRLPVEPSSTNGLLRRSWLMVDKLSTLPRTKIGRSVGRLTEADLRLLDQRLALFLGLSAAA